MTGQTHVTSTCVLLMQTGFMATEAFVEGVKLTSESLLGGHFGLPIIFFNTDVRRLVS